MKITKLLVENIEIIRLENSTISIDVAPSVGGKIVSIYSKILSCEFLWTNHLLKIQRYPIGTSYDPYFYGGVDELLPSDITEIVQGMEYPDHGELWTMGLNYRIEGSALNLFNKLSLCELYYEKIITIDKSEPLIHIDYTIRNDAAAVRNFLWKLHAALQIGESDQIECFARKAQVVDPDYSRFKSTRPFNWPIIEDTDASIVPEKNGSMDFYYLFGNQKGEMSMISSRKGSRFTIFFDTGIFPYLWYFASYGGFLDHYTAVLEPCTTMPISVNEAIALKQCSALEPGKSIKTRVSIYAGSINQSL